MNEEQKVNVLCIWQPNERLYSYILEGLEAYPQVNLIIPTDTTHETFLKLAKEYDPQIIMGWRPTKELLEAASNLRLFINPGAGVQHLIPLFKDVTKNRKITLVNGHGNAYFTAQHTVTLLLTLTNKIILHHNWMKEGEWRKGDSHAASTPLRDRKVGFLGYGAVNQNVHRFLSGFDVDFAVLRNSWNKQETPLPTPVTKYTYDQLHGFLEDVDILIIAVPLTSKTEGMIGQKELELLGNKGLIVNVGRGLVIEEESLYSALKNKTISGAAIDVWYNYQPEPDSDGRKYPTKYPFHELENVVLSPHRGASPMNDLERWDEQIENISRYARGEKIFLNMVNLDEEY
jgi:phosphoglycerate dehydrogenase-like enzyme